MIYLAKAWRLAGGDLCRALMKYRAGHGEEIMSARSRIYCNRARNRLVAMNSAFVSPDAVAAIAPIAAPAATALAPAAAPAPADEARIRTIKARIETKWKRVASR